MVTHKILLVDDEEIILKHMRSALEPEYRVFAGSTEREAMAIFAAERPSVVILDLSLDPCHPADLGGMRLLEYILREEPSTRAIVVTGNDDDQNALRAVRLGAFDYYAKPVQLEELRVMIKRACHIHELHRRAHQNAQTSENGFWGMVGSSKSMNDILRFVERVAESDISVLIRGESGTGKEVVARAIHLQSQRKNHPFVIVNCSAIPDNLLESELFGHEKVAPTGALSPKLGKFEMAHGGSLFFDEVGELTRPLQVKLLRFLQHRKVERVDGAQSIDLDVRIIAATNRDLKKDVENRLFREDLYYRLKVVPLDIPPLRERKEDIIPLSRYFLTKLCRDQRKAPITLSPEAQSALLTHPWPGNVRELENLISRAVVLSARSILQASDLGFASDENPTNVNLKFAKKAIEMDFVRKALRRNSGIISRAARELGISRVNLYELMEKYNIRIQEFKMIKAGAQPSIRTREIS